MHVQAVPAVRIGTQAPTAPCPVLSCYIHDVSGRSSVYTAKDMWSNASQTTSASGLSDQTMMHLDGRLHSAVHL